MLLCSFDCFEKFEHICEDLNLALKKGPQVAILHSTARVLRKEHTSFQLRRSFVERGVAEKHRLTFENTALLFEFSLLAQRYRMLSVLEIIVKQARQEPPLFKHRKPFSKAFLKSPKPQFGS